MKQIVVMLFLSLFILSGCAQIEQLEMYINKFTNDEGSKQKDLAEDDHQLDKLEGQNGVDLNEKDGVILESIYFNDVKNVEGKPIIQNPENILALVNKQFALPGNYIPNDLLQPNVAFSFGNLQIEKSLMRNEAATALEQMFQEAKQNGMELFAVSGYRSYDRQVEVMEAEINQVGEDKAIQAVAIPGHSEHQSGLAMDISSENVDYLLTEEFEKTREGKWLKENAHRFGFILRYPKGKEGITGYKFEPWHFRYVGIKNATIMFEKGWTLEEFFNQVKKI